MFCPNCGNQLPDGSAFCGNCGASLKEQQQPQYQASTQQPAYQAPAQPQYQPPMMPTAPMNPITKKEFLATKASPETKKNAKLVMATFIITLALIATSVFVSLAMPFFDIPAMSFILSMADADPDELTDSMEDAYDEVEYSYEIQKSTMDRDEREDGKKLLDSMEALTDNFSILNFNKLVSLMEDVGDDYLSRSEMDEIEEVGQIMNLVIGFIVGFFVLPLIFTLIGGLTKSTGLTVTALVFTVLSQLILSGFIWALLSLVVYIVQAVLCSKIHKAYQDYRMGRFA